MLDREILSTESYSDSMPPKADMYLIFPISKVHDRFGEENNYWSLFQDKARAFMVFTQDRG